MVRSHFPLQWLNISRITFASPWHVYKHLQMLSISKRHAQLHTFPCLCPSSPFLHTQVRVLKLETASTVSERNQAFLGWVVRKISSGGGRRLFSACTGFSYWLCTSPKGDLPACILSDNHVFGKSKVTLSAGFRHSDPKPNLSWCKPQEAWLHFHGRGPRLALHAVVSCLHGHLQETSVGLAQMVELPCTWGRVHHFCHPIPEPWRSTQSQRPDGYSARWESKEASPWWHLSSDRITSLHPVVLV